MTRRCFYSFHYQGDAWRAGQVRNIGKIEGNTPTSPNDWEQIKLGGDRAIRKWITYQLIGRTCTIVLVGSETAKRRWVRYEITKSWNRGMGVVGIYIHGLEDSRGQTSKKGDNPFRKLRKKSDKSLMSEVTRCWTPKGKTSNERYRWIRTNLGDIVELAIQERKRFGH